MKRLTILLAVVVLGAVVARADEGKPMTNAGNGAWIFSFSGLSSFGVSGLFGEGLPYGSLMYGGTPDGASGGTGVSPAVSYGSGYVVPGVGARYYLANDLAIRGGLALGVASGSSKNSNTSLSDNTSSAFILGIQAILEKHLEGLGAISPYIGGGIHVGIASTDVKNYVTSTTTTESSGSSTAINILAALGFEWFFMNHVSLGGEYQIGLGLLSGSRTDKSTGSPDNEVKFPSSMSIGTGSLSVLLSIYP